MSIRSAEDVGKSTLADDVRSGLSSEFKELPPKHLYDATGSQLFDEICGVPEYYPTRTERSILEARAGDIAACTGASELVELGAGTAAKTRVLLDALRSAGTLKRYVPFDIDGGIVRDTADQLAAEYPQLTAIDGVVGDFEHDLGLIPAPLNGETRIVALLGGTIGNLMTEPRRELLRGIADLLGPDGYLLLGADLVKDPAVIEAAYNDSAGITARFNRNVLSVINRELDADFPVDQFEHVAFYNTEDEWIEMRLRALSAVHVKIDKLDLELDFSQGEELRTEISAKFTPARLQADLAASNLQLNELMTDPQQRFALVLASPADPAQPSGS